MAPTRGKDQKETQSLRGRRRVYKNREIGGKVGSGKPIFKQKGEEK